MSIIDEKRLAEIALTREDLARYSRHLILPEVNVDGQRRIGGAGRRRRGACGERHGEEEAHVDFGSIAAGAPAQLCDDMWRVWWVQSPLV